MNGPGDRSDAGARLGSGSGTGSRPGRCAAVVLAGGASRRFGTDKLAVVVDGAALLDQALAGLPGDAQVFVVGPARPTARPVTFLRENPPGGGPTAAMVTGLRAALATHSAEIVVLPGDAPHAGQAAVALLAARGPHPAAAVVATDGEGFEQPLQLALGRAAARALVEAAGAEQGHGASARALVLRLDPPVERYRLPAEGHWDIDTPAQLAAWAARGSGAVAAVLGAVDRLSERSGPVVVALDGHSGAGKSTLAAALSLARAATVLSGDDFYSPRLDAYGHRERRAASDAAVMETVFDWRRLREEALEPLARGEAAQYAPYDWSARDGRLARPRVLLPAPLVVLEGVYSARPELSHLVDVAVLVEVDHELRSARRALREQDHDDWVAFWERGERHYFQHVRPPESFDLRVTPVGRGHAETPGPR